MQVVESVELRPQMLPHSAVAHLMSKAVISILINHKPIIISMRRYMNTLISIGLRQGSVYAHKKLAFLNIKVFLLVSLDRIYRGIVPKNRSSVTIGAAIGF